MKSGFCNYVTRKLGYDQCKSVRVHITYTEERRAQAAKGSKRLTEQMTLRSGHLEGQERPFTARETSLRRRRQRRRLLACLHNCRRVWVPENRGCEAGRKGVGLELQTVESCEILLKMLKPWAAFSRQWRHKPSRQQGNGVTQAVFWKTLCLPDG